LKKAHTGTAKIAKSLGFAWFFEEI